MIKLEFLNDKNVNLMLRNTNSMALCFLLTLWHWCSHPQKNFLFTQQVTFWKFLPLKKVTLKKFSYFRCLLFTSQAHLRVSWDDPLIQFLLVSTLLNLVLMVWILWVSFSALHQEKRKKIRRKMFRNILINLLNFENSDGLYY